MPFWAKANPRTAPPPPAPTMTTSVFSIIYFSPFATRFPARMQVFMFIHPPLFLPVFEANRIRPHRQEFVPRLHADGSIHDHIQPFVIISVTAGPMVH